MDMMPTPCHHFEREIWKWGYSMTSWDTPSICCLAMGFLTLCGADFWRWLSSVLSVMSPLKLRDGYKTIWKLIPKEGNTSAEYAVKPCADVIFTIDITGISMGSQSKTLILLLLTPRVLHNMQSPMIWSTMMYLYYTSREPYRHFGHCYGMYYWRKPRNCEPR
jgi:hypothetical protein